MATERPMPSTEDDAPDPPPTPRRYSLWRMLKRTLFWLFILVIVAIATAYLYLQTDEGREFVRELALDALNGEIRGRLEVDRIDGHLPFSATFHGVRVYDPDNRLVVSASELHADVKPLALIYKLVHLQNITVVDPSFTLLDDQGRVAIGEAFAPRVPSEDDGTTSPWTVRLVDLSLERGQFDEAFVSSLFQFEQLDVDLDLTVKNGGVVWKDLVLTTKTVRGKGVLAVLPETISVQSSGRVLPDGIELTQLEVSAGTHHLLGTANFRLSEPLSVSARLDKLIIDLDALPTGFVPPWATGLVTADGVVATDSGEATVQLATSSVIGDVTVQGSVDVLSWNYDLRASFVNLAPGVITDAVPAAWRGDGSVRVSGVGDPTSGGAITLDLDVLETAPNAGGRLDLQAGRPSTESPEDGQLFTFVAAADGFTLGPWLSRHVGPDMEGRLDSWRGEGTLFIPLDGLPELQLDSDGAIAFLGVIPGLSGGRLNVSDATFSTNLQWAGAGVPFGSVSLHATDVTQAGMKAGLLSADLEVGSAPGDGFTVEGVVSAMELALGEGRAAEQAVVALDVAFADPTSLPAGRVGVELDSAQFDGNTVARLDSTFRINPERNGQALAIVGTTDSRMLVLAGVGRADNLSANLDGELSLSDGTYVGRVTTRGRSIVAQAGNDTATAKTLYADLAIDASRGYERIALKGPLKLTGVRHPEATVGTLDARVDLALVRGLPVGTVDARTKAVVAGGERFDAADVSATLKTGGAIAYKLKVVQGRIEVSARGDVQLPVGRKQLSATIDILDTKVRGRNGEVLDVVKLGNITLTPDGWITLDKATLIGGDDSQGIVASGRFHPDSGRIDIHVVGKDLRVATWLNRIPALIEGWPMLPAIDGIVAIDMHLKGKLDAVYGNIQLGLSDGRLESFSDMSALMVATLDPKKGLTFGLGVGWYDRGRVQLNGSLPISVSAVPPGVDLPRDRAMSVKLSFKEEDLGVFQRWITGLSSMNARDVLKGRAQIDVALIGTLDEPTISISGEAVGLSAGPRPPFDVTLQGSSAEERSRLKLIASRDGEEVLTVDAAAPFDAIGALRRDDPGAFLEQRVREQRGRITLGLKATRLDDLPIAPYFPEAARELTVSAQLAGEGTIERFALSGVTSATPLPGLGVDSGMRAFIATDDSGLMRTQFTLRSRDRVVADGSIELAELVPVVFGPQGPRGWLEREDTKLEIFTADVTSAEIWDYSPAIGQVLTDYLPEGRAMVAANIRGGPKGPRLNLTARVRNTAEPSRAAELSTAAFDDLRVVAIVDEQKTALTLTALQRPPRLADGSPDPFSTPRFVVDAVAKFGLGELLLNEAAPWQNAALEGQLEVTEFSIDSLTRSLGGARGMMQGRVQLAGTLAKPEANGMLECELRDLSSGDLGFHEDIVPIYVEFDGPKVALVPLHLEGDGDDTRTGVTVVDSWLDLELGATLNGLSADKIPITGRIGMKKFPLLGRDDLTLKLGGDIALSGTAAVPRVRGDVEVRDGLVTLDLTGGGARPLGPPTDVTYVSGRPLGLEQVVTEEEDYSTGADIDVNITIPKDRLRLLHVVGVDNFFTLPGADLSPHGALRLLTDEGRIGLVGTIYVPRDRVEIVGRKFALDEESRLVFTGDLRTDPTLLVQARYDISDVDLSGLGLEATEGSHVLATITGDAQAPKLVLTSDPPMDESAIVSILVVGTPVTSDAEGGRVVDELTNALTAIIGGQLDQLTKQLQVIDKVDFDGRRLTLSKRLTRDLIVYYRRILANEAKEGESTDEFVGEYKLGDVMNIEGRWGLGETFSLELNFRLRE